MNNKMYDLAFQVDNNPALESWVFNNRELEQFVELIKQAIYDEVKGELIDDKDIAAESDPLIQEYLKGCNSGTVDALCHIKNFGVDIEL